MSLSVNGCPSLHLSHVTDYLQYLGHTSHVVEIGSSYHEPLQDRVCITNRWTEPVNAFLFSTGTVININNEGIFS